MNDVMGPYGKHGAGRGLGAMGRKKGVRFNEKFQRKSEEKHA